MSVAPPTDEWIVGESLESGRPRVFHRARPRFFAEVRECRSGPATIASLRALDPIPREDEAAWKERALRAFERWRPTREAV